MKTCRIVVLLPALALLTACGSIFAPPMRSTHMIPSGRTREGALELGGSVGGIGNGGPQLSLGITDWFAAEAGGDFHNQGWALGFTGARFTPLKWQRLGVSVALDLELGLSVGAGGQFSCSEEYSQNYSDCSAWEKNHYTETWDSLAYGGYLGLGFGVNVDFFSFFLRARQQFAFADNLPETMWLSGILGVGFSIVDTVNLYLGAGAVQYWNQLDQAGAGLVEVGVTIRTDLW